MDIRAGEVQEASSRRRLSLTWALLVGLVLALTLSASYTSVLIIRRQTALDQISRHSVSWTISQAATEVARLHAAVGAYAVNPGPAEHRALRLRMDLVASRIPMLEGGEAGEFTRGHPEREATIRAFKDTAAVAEDLLPRLDEPGVPQRLAAALTELHPKLGRLASAAHAQASEGTARDLQELGRIHWLFSCLLMGLILCSFALIAVLIRGNRMLRRAHGEVQLLIGDLRRTGSDLAAAHARTQEAMREVQLQNLALKERDRDLHTQYARFDAALNNMSQGLCMADAAQRLIVCNSRFLELFGLDGSLARPGAPMAEVFRAIGAGSGYDTRAIEKIRREQQVLVTKARTGSILAEGEDGRALAVSHRPMAEGGWVATYEDATERRNAEARIRFMAHHDSLTGLPNRVLFRERMDEALRMAGGRTDRLALLCLDLDDFKTVNDTLGHPAGDALLEAAGQRLQGCIRGGDFVARLGGDEFAIIQLSADQPRDAQSLAQRVIEVLSVPYDVAGRRVVAGVSVGIAVAEGEADADLLLRNADLALYRAKAAGRGRHRVFEAAMEAEVQARLAIESDLREALALGQFEVFYQPLFGLAADRVSGCEALLRWRHPERGLVPPGVFIPIAEDLGLIARIGEWVLRQACADAATWPDGVKVAVNLSPIQFLGGDIVRAVADALAASGLPAQRLELEITESVLLQDNAGTLDLLHRLRDLGLRIALDDFGTGYSSLSYLRSFPFDKIKIDRSFVSELGARPDCGAIVNSISGLAADLGMATTAEGVETPEQLGHVRLAGCTEAQGYLFGKAQPAAEIRRSLAAGRGLLPADAA